MLKIKVNEVTIYGSSPVYGPFFFQKAYIFKILETYMKYK